MVQSLDFILTARCNKVEMDKIEACLARTSDCEIVIDRHRLIFNPAAQTVTVKRKSYDAPCSSKIIDCRMPFDVLRRLLDGNYDDMEGFEWL